MITLLTPPYAARPVPTSYDKGWLGYELRNIQRAIPSVRVRTVVQATDVPTSQDHTILYDATTAPITVTLPLPSQSAGLYLVLKKIDASANAVTIVGTVDGAVNPTLATQYKSMTIQSDGTTYYKLGGV